MGIILFFVFNILLEVVLKDNLVMVMVINYDVDVNICYQVLVDVESVEYFYFLSDVMGLWLGWVFFVVYDKGELGKVVVLIKVLEVSIGVVKKYFYYLCFYQVLGNIIYLMLDDVVVKDGYFYIVGGGVFFSGYMNIGYMDVLLMVEMILECFDVLVICGVCYGYFCLVFGVYYLLDVMGVWMVV